MCSELSPFEGQTPFLCSTTAFPAPIPTTLSPPHHNRLTRSAAPPRWTTPRDHIAIYSPRTPIAPPHHYRRAGSSASSRARSPLNRRVCRLCNRDSSDERTGPTHKETNRLTHHQRRARPNHVALVSLRPNATEDVPLQRIN